MTAPSKRPPRSPGPLMPWRFSRVPPVHSALFVDSAPRQLLKLVVPSLDVSSAPDTQAPHHQHLFLHSSKTCLQAKLKSMDHTMSAAIAAELRHDRQLLCAHRTADLCWVVLLQWDRLSILRLSRAGTRAPVGIGVVGLHDCDQKDGVPHCPAHNSASSCMQHSTVKSRRVLYARGIKPCPSGLIRSKPLLSLHRARIRACITLRRCN